MKRLSESEAEYLEPGDSVVFDPRESLFDRGNFGLALGGRYQIQDKTPAFKSGEGTLLGWYMHIGGKEVPYQCLYVDDELHAELRSRGK